MVLATRIYMDREGKVGEGGIICTRILDDNYKTNKPNSQVKYPH